MDRRGRDRMGVGFTTICDKVVSDLRQVGGFLHRHNMTEILLKVALNTIT